MEYLDTNLFVYSFLNKDQPKGILSTQIIDNSVSNNSLVLSSLSIQEFIYVLAKSKISKNIIFDYFTNLQKYIKDDITIEVLSDAVFISNELDFYRNINDCIHLRFAERHCTKLITFDKDFEKFRPYTKLEIEILN